MYVIARIRFLPRSPFFQPLTHIHGPGRGGTVPNLCPVMEKQCVKWKNATRTLRFACSMKIRLNSHRQRENEAQRESVRSLRGRCGGRRTRSYPAASYPTG